MSDPAEDRSSAGDSRPDGSQRGARSTGTFEGRHGTSPVALASWVTEGLDLSNVQTVADLGCGDGRFVLPVAQGLGPNGEVYAVDSSPQLLARLQSNAKDAGLSIKSINADLLDTGQLPEGEVDLVMLNFVLNLMRRPQIDQCLDRVRALLRPGGCLLVTTYGRHHMADPYGWLNEALVSVGMPSEDADRATGQLMSRARPVFTLDNGSALLRPHFDRIVLSQFHDVLEAPISEVENLVGPQLLSPHRLSRVLPDGVSPDGVRRVLRDIMESRAVNGVLRLRSDIGTLLATGVA